MPPCAAILQDLKGTVTCRAINTEIELHLESTCPVRKLVCNVARTSHGKLYGAGRMY
jgi:hypothetical protein